MIKKLLKIFIIIILLLLIIAGSGIYYITSGKGNNWLTAKVNQLADTPTFKLRIVNLEGRLLSDFSVGGIVLSDAKGEYLKIEGLKFSWAFMKVAQGGAGVNNLSAKKVELLRLPVPSKKAEKKNEEAKTAASPESILRFLPKKISVNEIIIDRSISGKQLELNLAGNGSEKAYVLDLKTLKGPETTMNINMPSLSEEIFDIDARLNLTDISALPVPDLALKGSIKGDIKIKGPLDKLAVDIVLNGRNISLNNFPIAAIDSKINSILNSKAEEQKDIIHNAYIDSVIEVAKGKVNINGNIVKDNISLQTKVRDIKTEVLPVSDMPKGTVNADIKISNKLNDPVINITSDNQFNINSNKISMTLVSDWVGDSLKARIIGKTGKADFNADAGIKGALSLLPFKTDISAKTPLVATAKGLFPLDMMNPILRPKGHRVAGLISMNANVKGALGKPEINGKINFDKGEYENIPSGVCMKNMKAEADITPQKLTLKSFTSANGEKGGTFSAKADVAFKENKTLSSELVFNEYKLFCSGLATGVINGPIKISGNISDMLVNGDLRLGPLNVQIPGNGNSVGIPEVKTVWVEKEEKKKKLKAEKPNNVKLDIKIAAPNRVYVSGRGLDAEFEGDIHIGGTAAAPDIAGTLESKRGTFKFLDRLLDLDKTSIVFQGPIPPSPFLDISASTEAKDTKITISLTGQASKPLLSLSSDPPLPQDEVLALFLFGREIDKISPFQALKLANAARILAGEAEETDVLAGAREALGLDTLELESDDNNQTSVSSGKYITDKVYVGIKQGKDIESKQVVTEIELTPAVSAKTSVDGTGGQSFGVQWKRDY